MNNVPWRHLRSLLRRGASHHGKLQIQQRSAMLRQNVAPRQAHFIAQNISSTSPSLHWRRSFTAATAGSASEPATPQKPTDSDIEVPDHLSEGERHVFEKLLAALAPVKLEVRDVSGGCGSMYAIDIECSDFRGLTVIKQHRKVQEILADEIKGWHGVQLRTKASS